MAELKGGEMSTVEFGALTGDVVTHGAVCLSVGMAQETGLMDVLLTADQPMTSTQLAHKAGLKERYVRENLSAMASARLLQLPESDTQDGEVRYFVPEQHRPAFTKLGVFSLYLSTAGRCFSSVKECFPLDGPWCIRYKEEQFAMMDRHTQYRMDETVEVLVDAPVIKDKLASGAELKVAEFGCGHGRLGRRLAGMFPQCHFTMTDIAEAPLKASEARARDEGITNIDFQMVNIFDVPKDWYGRFDWVLVQNVIHDLPHPAQALEAVAKVLKPGGVFTMIDLWVASDVRDNVGNPKAALLYSLSQMFCLPESYQEPDSEALGACWGEQRVRAMTDQAGLTLMEIRGGPKMHHVAVYTCHKPL